MSQRSMYKYSNGDIVKHRKEDSYLLIAGFGSRYYDYYVCVPLNPHLDGREMPAHLIDMHWQKVA